MKGPVLLNFEGKRALVIGGGKVGLRRAQTLAGYGCLVTCMDEKMSEPAVQVPGICYIKANYTEATTLEGMDFVVAATESRDFNARILKNCKTRRILCNVTDNPEHSDFIFPSVVKRGDLTLSVCTDGASPFLTTKIKKELEEKYDKSYTRRVALLKKLRYRALEATLSPIEKRERLQFLANLTLEELEKEMEK